MTDGVASYLCGGCGGLFTRPEMITMTNEAGVGGLRCKACHSEAMKDDIARRVGTTDVTCATCGTKVPVHQSVRSFIPKTNNRGMVTGTQQMRVCKFCEGTDPIPPWCRTGEHRVVLTPASDAWDAAPYPFEPLPETAKPGRCAECGMALIWRARWVEMNWGFLAEEWQKAGNDT